MMNNTFAVFIIFKLMLICMCTNTLSKHKLWTANNVVFIILFIINISYYKFT